jgi:hypothetical protein
LIAGRPLAVVGIVLFTVLFLATGLSDPKNPSHVSAAPLAVIAVLAALSTGYVLLWVPKLQAAAAARAAANRPRRRPQRPESAGVEGRTAPGGRATSVEVVTTSRPEPADDA